MADEMCRSCGSNIAGQQRHRCSIKTPDGWAHLRPLHELLALEDTVCPTREDPDAECICYEIGEACRALLEYEKLGTDLEAARAALAAAQPEEEK